MYLNERDTQIIETLTLKVRLLTRQQIAQHWWPHTKDRTKPTHALQHLLESGFLERFYVNARLLDDLRAPIFAWKPGSPTPDYPALSLRLRLRWKQPSQNLSVYIASKFAGSWLGGKGGVLHPDQASHDIHVAAVFLQLLRKNPPDAAAWVGEDLRPKAGFRIKDPDAFLEYSGQRPTVVVEFGGAYDPKRVRDFHEHCAKHKLCYQLW